MSSAISSVCVRTRRFATSSIIRRRRDAAPQAFAPGIVAEAPHVPRRREAVADVQRLMIVIHHQVVADDLPGTVYVAVRFDLDDGQALLYDDVRRFGRLHVHDNESWTGQDAVLGAEPLGEHLSARSFHDLTQRSRTPIRNWLLDQRRIVGVGNIYANEALFRARIAPTRPANSLSRAEAGQLLTELREVLQEAITARGTTISDFRDEQGESGGFAPRLRVYGRAGEPCLNCGSTIERVVLSNRTIRSSSKALASFFLSTARKGKRSNSSTRQSN